MPEQWEKDHAFNEARIRGYRARRSMYELDANPYDENSKDALELASFRGWNAGFEDAEKELYRASLKRESTAA